MNYATFYDLFFGDMVENMIAEEKRTEKRRSIDVNVDNYILSPPSKFVFYDKNLGVNLEVNVDVDRVIFNPPATIVFWKDGTKTVVKACDEDSYSPEGGFALCFLKKVLGGKDNFHRYLKDSCGEALKKFEDRQKPIVF